MHRTFPAGTVTTDPRVATDLSANEKSGGDLYKRIRKGAHIVIAFLAIVNGAYDAVTHYFPVAERLLLPVEILSDPPIVPSPDSMHEPTKSPTIDLASSVSET